jgi:hypothetical protein
MELENIDSDELEKLFLEDALEEMVAHEALDLLLLVISEKPGASVTAYFQGISAGFRSFVEEFSQEFGIAYITREVEGEKESRENVTGSKVFLARESERLEMLKPFKDTSSEDIGRFLEYPEKSVEEFETSRGFKEAYSRFQEMIEDDSVSEDEALDFLEENTSGKSYAERFDEKVQEMTEKGDLEEEERRYLNLVSYVPQIENEAVLEAVEEGQRREKILIRMDDELEVEVGEAYLEKIL